MDFTFKTIAEFNDYFKDEKTCYDFLEGQRWNGVIVCPHCGSLKKPYKVKPRSKFKDIPSYRCAERACDLPFTVRTKSIFEGSNVELRKWFQAAYELSTAKKGISSVELATRINVSQKTAWFINHRLRAMLTDVAPELLTGMVEVDETWVGGKEKNKSKSKRAANKAANTNNEGKARHAMAKDTKTPVLGLLQRDGKVILQPMLNTSKHTLLPILASKISKDATVVTDGLPSYKTLGNTYKLHVVVNHAKDEWVNGQYHTNSIEGFWSLLKRGIVGTFHVVSAKHLHRYCDEFSYRFNNRSVTNAVRFNESIKKCANARLTYSSLTNGK